MRQLLLPVGLAFIIAAASAARAEDAPQGNADAGKTIFNRQCAVCHSPQPGQNKLGPSLAGVYGRHAAEAPGYNYSPAMHQANRTWNAETLNTYLRDPRATVPGTRMIFAGLKDDHQRADVIAYLETLK